jgi:hypothetical protein
MAGNVNKRKLHPDHLAAFVCRDPHTSPAIWLTCWAADCKLKLSKRRAEPIGAREFPVPTNKFPVRAKNFPVHGRTGNCVQRTGTAARIDAEERQMGGRAEKFSQIPCSFPCSQGIRGWRPVRPARIA